MQDDGSTQVKNTSKHCPKTYNSLCRMLIICNTLLPFKRHSRNAFGVHEGFIVYTSNQIATFCSEPAKGGKDAYVLEEKYIGR